MNVTTVGVKGYEYQYKVTVFLALALWSEKKLEIYSEKAGSEDITISIKNGSSVKRIEIQVKRERKSIKIIQLTDWLCHFQERSSDNNLLFRLSDDSSNIALFITQSRCSDQVVTFKRDMPDISGHENLIIDKKWNKSFLNGIINNKYSKSVTLLGKRRNEFCRSQSESFKNISKIINALSRVIIWEEITDDIIDISILSYLNRRVKIPQSLTEDVYLNLLQAVRNGRDHGLDITPMISEIINKRAVGRPLVDQRYKPRAEENDLIKNLIENNLLLLTGISLCGKSELAKSVANYFFENGFNYRIFNDINELNHFFSLNPQEDKIAILEDPWGHLQIEENSFNKWHQVEQIVANLPLNHKLIITSRSEIIQEIHSFKSISKCNIKGYAWKDVTVRERETLIEFWRSISLEKELPHKISETVNNYLHSAEIENILQIGQLEYLSSVEIDNLENKNISELENIARQNSLIIAQTLKEKDQDIAELLAILALCATTINSTRMVDIAYVFSTDENAYSIVEREVWISSLDRTEALFPEYKEIRATYGELEKKLEYLESRNFIVIKNEQIYFTHPNYYEAGRNLFFSVSSLSQKRFLHYFKKTLSCLNPQSALLAVKQFYFIVNNINEIYKEEIFQLAFYALDSIFPAVEDNIMVFLIAYVDFLPDEDKGKVVQRLDGFDTSSSHIFWHKKETPFISRETSISFLDRFFELETDEFENLDRQFHAGNIVKPFDAWNYLISIQNGESKKLDKEIVKSLMQYEEVFIRKRVTTLFFSGDLEESEIDIIRQIFQDQHPSVIFNAIRGVFLGWKRFGGKIKDLLFLLLRSAFESQSVAIRANQLMTTFAKEHTSESINWESFNSDEKKELWNVWGKLFPIFIDKLPPNVFLNPGRFGMTMDEALNYLTIDIGIEVLVGWYKRIDYKISHGHYLDEYELAIADNLLQFTKSDYVIRKEIFNDLINYQETNFLLSSLKWIVEYWGDLHSSEREKILMLIKSERKDARWIKAVLLNSHSSPPADIQAEILGERNFFDRDIESIVGQFPTDLLQDCLNVYCGHPQPLWWLAVHHKNRDFWDKIIRYVLRNHVESYFEICLREILSDGVNGFSKSWADGIEIWKQICENSKEKKALAYRLIYETATCNCNIDTTKELWLTLIESYKSNDKIDFIADLIADNIEMIQETGDKEDILAIFDRNFLFGQVFPLIKPDSIIASILYDIKNIPEEAEELSIKLEIVLSKFGTIRFFATKKIIENLLAEISVSKSLKDKLNTFPDKISINGKEKLDELKAIEEYKLADWIGLN